MSKNLVIVESPAKASTISKYLGKDFDVLASYGHVRDLIPKEGAVDPENDFSMKYQVIERNEKHVKAIQRALKKADALYLATDPDREGEAISWHLIELLKEREALVGKDVHRVIFHEITKQAVRDAVDNPREISGDLVGAHEASHGGAAADGLDIETAFGGQRLDEGRFGISRCDGVDAQALWCPLHRHGAGHLGNPCLSGRIGVAAGQAGQRDDGR